MFYKKKLQKAIICVLCLFTTQYAVKAASTPHEYTTPLKVYVDGDCLMFLFDIMHTGPDGKQGGGDDIHVASGVVRGPGCDLSNVPPNWGDLQFNLDWQAALSGITVSGSCTNYEVEIFDVNGDLYTTGIVENCLDFKRETYKVKTISVYNPKKEINFYPSISNSKIIFENNQGLKSIQVFTLNMVLVDEINIGQAPSLFFYNISELSNGMYIVHSELDGSLFTGKFLKTN
jgi:hypothetical protein